MYQQQNSGEVVLQLGHEGLAFVIASEPALTFADSRGSKKSWKRIISSLFLSIGLWSLPLFTQAASTTSADLIDHTNQIRVEHGLATLTNNVQLEQAALAKAQDMIAGQYFAHTSPTGITPWSFFTSAGYRFTSAAENLALEPKAAADPTAAWMASSAHRQNILDPKFRDIGITVVSGTFQGKPATFIVQFFGSRRATVTAQPTLSTGTVIPTATISDQKLPITTTPIAPSDLIKPASKNVPIPVTPDPEVLGLATRVIPTHHLSQVVVPDIDPRIATLVLSTLGFYLIILVGAVIIQKSMNQPDPLNQLTTAQTI